jgi:hypothetical protein
MASQPVSPVAPELEESLLSRNDGWDLIFSLFGTAKDLYAPYGGGEAWLRSERAGWNEKDAAH